VLTLSVPLFNHWVTRKVDDIDYYPGEIGLPTGKRAQTQSLQSNQIAESNPWGAAVPLDVPAFQGSLRVGEEFSAFLAAKAKATQALQQGGNQAGEEKRPFAPYVREALKDGNPLPLALTLLPIPFAVGMFDTVKRQFLNPFAKGFGGKWLKMYDFTKGFPFTTQQQVASLFALLIGSRLANARSGNEFRERLVDSMLGWGIWILATPFLKEQFAKRLDPTGKTLWKTVDGQFKLRSMAEAEKLLDPKLAAKTAGRLKWIGRGSTLITMVLLGIVEPLLAILWTKHRSERMANEPAA
jgi:hypothetical protein